MIRYMIYNLLGAIALVSVVVGFNYIFDSPKVISRLTKNDRRYMEASASKFALEKLKKAK